MATSTSTSSTALSVPCPWCGAEARQVCRADSGRPMGTVHRDRDRALMGQAISTAAFRRSLARRAR